MKIRKLNRDSNSRKALFKNLLRSLVQEEEIKTTYAKASSVKRLADKLISKAISGKIHDRRMVQAELQDSTLVSKLFNDIAARYKGGKGGYTRVTVIGNRKGDNALITKLALTKKSATPTTKAKTVAPKVAPPAAKAKVAAPKTAAPRVSKPTHTAASASGKSAIGRKSGDK